MRQIWEYSLVIYYTVYDFSSGHRDSREAKLAVKNFCTKTYKNMQ